MLAIRDCLTLNATALAVPLLSTTASFEKAEPCDEFAVDAADDTANDNNAGGGDGDSFLGGARVSDRFFVRVAKK